MDKLNHNPQAGSPQAPASGHSTYSVRITGKVQGVFFRDFTQRTADSLLVRGWVRNEPAGSVLALLQSSETQLIELLIERLKEGPPGAQVEDVYVEPLTDEPRHDSFVILR